MSRIDQKINVLKRKEDTPDKNHAITFKKKANIYVLCVCSTSN